MASTRRNADSAEIKLEEAATQTEETDRIDTSSRLVQDDGMDRVYNTVLSSAQGKNLKTEGSEHEASLPRFQGARERRRLSNTDEAAWAGTLPDLQSLSTQQPPREAEKKHLCSCGFDMQQVLALIDQRVELHLNGVMESMKRDLFAHVSSTLDGIALAHQANTTALSRSLSAHVVAVREQARADVRQLQHRLAHVLANPSDNAGSHSNSNTAASQGSISGEDDRNPATANQTLGSSASDRQHLSVRNDSEPSAYDADHDSCNRSESGSGSGSSITSASAFAPVSVSAAFQTLSLANGSESDTEESLRRSEFNGSGTDLSITSGWRHLSLGNASEQSSLENGASLSTTSGLSVANNSELSSW
jgi:hypothetical protein